jgi:two-component system, LytTR family, sensor histidine kinase AlgZ
MHPILADARLLGLYLLGCLPVGILLVIGLGHQGEWGTAAAFFLPLTLVYAFVGLSAYYLCCPFPISEYFRNWRAGPTQMTAAAVVGALCVALARVWATLLQSLNIGIQPKMYLEQPWLMFVVGALLFWLAIAFHYVLISSRASQRADKRSLESGLLAREAELKALRAQLDPHFLFNSLNSISSLTASDPTSARKMCLLLADFLRDTLRLGSVNRISLQEELTIVQRYLSIEQVRFGSRLNICGQASPQASVARVPALILQPLVENAVIHGIAHLLEGGTVTINAERENGTLVIRVSNPCDADRPHAQRAGFGLSLVRQRLESQFGVSGQLLVREDAGEFVSEVRLPFESTEGTLKGA